MQNDCLDSIKNYLEGSNVSSVKYIGEIHSGISTYSLPSSQARPFGLFYDQFASSHAYNDYLCNTISSWDIEDRESFFQKELFVFDFKIRTLCTPYQHKYNDLFLYNRNCVLTDLVRDLNLSETEIQVRHGLPSDVLFDPDTDEAPRIRIKGSNGFWEERL